MPAPPPSRKHLDPNWIVAVISLTALALSFYASYNANDRSLWTSVATLQARDIDTKERLDRIESKIDTIFFTLTGERPAR